MATDPEVRAQLVDTVRRFVEREVVPVASELEHADEYPAEIVDGMRELGLFGVTIPEEYGGLGLDLLTYCEVIEELSAGWMSLSGVLNTHVMAANLLKASGTDEQRKRWLPRLAAGEIPGALSLSEPDARSDTSAITCRGGRGRDEERVTGTEMGVARAAFDAAVTYAQQRETFGKPIAQHQAIQMKLADMGTQLHAARLMTLDAAARKEAGERTDVEAGMAKLFASEAAFEIATESMRIHGGGGFTPQLPGGRHYRDAPPMFIRGGHQQNPRPFIPLGLLDRHRLCAWWAR